MSVSPNNSTMSKKRNEQTYNYAASYISDDGRADVLLFESTPAERNVDFYRAHCEEYGIDFDLADLAEFEREYPVEDRTYAVVSEVGENDCNKNLAEAIAQEVDRYKEYLVTLERINALVEANGEAPDSDESKELTILQLLMEKHKARTNNEAYPEKIMKHKEVIYDAFVDIEPLETWDGVFYDLGKIQGFKEALRMLEGDK